MENPKNPKNNNAKGGSPARLDSDNPANLNNPNTSKNGNTNRDDKQAIAMDSDPSRADKIIDISQTISDKVSKKIESKNYLYDNLLRKQRENVSYETLQTKENENDKSVFDNPFVVFGLFCAVLFAIYKFLMPKKAVKTQENPLRENTSGDTSGESFSSLANDILLKTNESGA